MKDLCGLVWQKILICTNERQSDFHWTMIEVAKLQAMENPDKIVWYENLFEKTTRQWWAGQGWLAKENDIKKYLTQLGY